MILSLFFTSCGTFREPILGDMVCMRFEYFKESDRDGTPYYHYFWMDDKHKVPYETTGTEFIAYEKGKCYPMIVRR